MTSNGSGKKQDNGPRMPGLEESIKDTDRIRDVWQSNIYEEFKVIRQLLKKYSYVAMDTEFPGIVVKPIGDFKTNSDYQYELMRANVHGLKLIQLGLTLLDENGKTPPGICTWQFNFKFNLSKDLFAQESVDLLKRSGIPFGKMETDGVEHSLFSELLLSSGLVLMDEVTWVAFHGSFDFGYLLSILTDDKLPDNEAGFYDKLKIYIPNIYDVKYLLTDCKNLKGGLQEVAMQLNIKRVGSQHQAGSDALITGETFFRIKKLYFDNNIKEGKFNGKLYGIGSHKYSFDLTVYYTKDGKGPNIISAL